MAAPPPGPPHSLGAACLRAGWALCPGLFCQGCWEALPKESEALPILHKVLGPEYRGGEELEGVIGHPSGLSEDWPKEGALPLSPLHFRLFLMRVIDIPYLNLEGPDCKCSLCLKAHYWDGRGGGGLFPSSLMYADNSPVRFRE